jgi:hypothetical protein
LSSLYACDILTPPQPGKPSAHGHARAPRRPARRSRPRPRPRPRRPCRTMRGLSSLRARTAPPP